MRSDLLLDPKKRHDDLRLLAKAMRQRWDIGSDLRKTIINRLQTIVAEADDETAIKAISQIRAMEAQNQKDEFKQVDEILQRVISFAAQLNSVEGTGGNSAEVAVRASLSDWRNPKAEEKREG